MSINKNQFADGLEIMRRPILPLARLAMLLYLTGPFETVEELLAELVEPIETGGRNYEQPGQFLQEFLSPLRLMESLKNARPPAARILDENQDPLDPMEGLELLISQQALTMELEKINSLLCRPCGCKLCCIGPEDTLAQEYFEIPLTEDESRLFALSVVNNDLSRKSLPADEPPVTINGRPFYEGESRIYHWRSGWSMVLPRHTSCPALDRETGGCRIYPDRPEVCRRPQIFPYVLERQPSLDIEYEGRVLQTFIRQKKLLAVWDCPYVKTLKDEIADYAEACELEPVFRENKA
ncbi:MAG: YkgJ family cysteine cluster protein [Proteobacteria bacterium]|nr:YkgJ family cysteine cluster protein [Pseudomonadota bacterium]MBU1737715.1 YkgJ family cysteine cluster protein [Pseudomonadota bacterium]